MNVFEQLFIGGRRIDSLGGPMLELRSPHDASVVGRTRAASTLDIDAAVAAARQAFDTGPWPALPPAERRAVLARFAELHAARAEEFAQLTSRENGSPLWFTRLLHGGIEAQGKAYLQAAESYPWETTMPGTGAGRTVWRREPVGVVAAVIPWNAPHQSALAKLFPALLAGCTVILKLAEETALGGQFLGELFEQAGLPPGVLSIVAADKAVSEHLVSHPGVDKVAFTGSTAAGRRIAAIAGGQLKRVSLELGGKSAGIVLDDADVPALAMNMVGAAFANNGESCVAKTRLLVPRERHDAIVSVLVAAASQWKVGDPSDPSTRIGPLVSKAQQGRVAGYIALGMAEGATLAMGGPGMPEGLAAGNYVRPTIFGHVNNTMRIAREEIFGPVLCVIPYDGVEEAIRIANDSDYGLSGQVWTADPARGLAVARRIRTGTFEVNAAAPDFRAPFGGCKQSGTGREFGTEGLGEYIQHKAITM
ncbi:MULTISPECIES: aldehyde dehydrogenase [unclassified Variovorax]|uniref:aldehyde dehydrogenase n=1 Tax=unclassified Variovorax TaxID=663243 RepID=UPI003F4639BB